MTRKKISEKKGYKDKRPEDWDVSDTPDLFRDLGFQVIVIDPGDEVLCDLCNEGYENSEEKGGFLFSSNAVCPKCAPKFEQSAKEFNEEQYIRARAKEGETFRDFVYRIRREGV